MKRLNPKTGKQFKRGDTCDIDNLFFLEYKTQISKITGLNYESWGNINQLKRLRESGTKWRRKNLEYLKTWRKEANITPEKRAKMMLKRSYDRALKKQILFSLTLDDLLPTILKGKCQLTGLPFDLTQNCDSYRNPYSPSIDRIDNNLGYVKENIRIVLTAVNITLNEFGEDTILPILKAMVKAIEKNVKKKSTTSVPAGPYIQGAIGAELGSVSTPRTWEDSNDAHHHCGADARKDVDCGTEAGSGVSVGHGGQEVGTFDVFDHIESSGVLEAAPRRLRESFERLRSESREPSLAAGTASQIRQFGD